MSNSPAEIDFTKIKVLVIDDDEWMRLLLRKYLNVFGVQEIFEAANGIEGFALLRNSKPDIIICDINMTELNGFQFVKHVRSSGFSRNKVPVIFLTGDANPEYVQRAKELGVEGYLVKPITAKDLKKKIADLLSQDPSIALPSDRRS